MKYKSLALAISAAGFSLALQAAENTRTIESIEIIGSQSSARQLPGSGAVVDYEQMRIEAAVDINQLLKTVPGIYIREEDGQGLRPNIGVRAAGSDRAGKVTLMEDGVLIAPAPYSNPAAYYFPTILRMSSVEILKGAPLLRHGPQTTGGVVNLLSTPIPEQNTGSLLAMTGQYNTRDLQAWFGGRQDNGIGFLIETAQRDSDGFKDIDRSGRDAGYDIEDYLVKLDWRGERQSLLLKMQYSQEVSNETYFGLTDSDFNASPNRRYGLSEIDQMDNHHAGLNLSYSFSPTDGIGFTVTAYRNEFARDWFKLGGAGSLISSANAGDQSAMDILHGTADTTGLEYKHNNRAYLSQGVQGNLSLDMAEHYLELGARLHADEMDRFQPVEIYDQVNGSLVYDTTIAATGGDNRLEEGEALSLWLTDNWQLNRDLNINLALRYEDVESARLQYDDPARTILGGSRANKDDQWLPGASFTWDLNPSWQVLAGVHKGFSPLGGGAVASEESETSINYEAGVRFNEGNLFLELIGFQSDFDNKSENCSLASPCSNGDTSGSFTTGEAVVSGIEIKASNRIESGSWSIPLDLAYTLTRGEISRDDAVTGFRDGDNLADIPDQTVSLRVGLEHESGWNNYAVAKYIDELCMSVACERLGGDYDRSEDLLVFDLISRYRMNTDTELFLKLENVFDNQEIISRLPDGARPNKPRTAMAGIQFSF